MSKIPWGAILSPLSHFFMPLLTLVIYSSIPAISIASETPLKLLAPPPTLTFSNKNDEVIIITTPQESPLNLTLTSKLPHQAVPASDGADYLKTIPGFATIRNGGTNGDLVFRGMFGSRLRLLVDNGEILGTCLSRMDSSSSYISPESYDIVSLIKGPQTVLLGAGASAGTVRFERLRPHFDAPGTTLHNDLLFGSNGRLDKNIDIALGNPFAYLRFIGNTSRASDYQSSDGHTTPSAWCKWNSDIIIGLTPDENNFVELTLGKSDGYARYATRSKDGTRFNRESLGIRLNKHDIYKNLEKIEMQAWYHYTNHVMDNYFLRPLRYGEKKMQGNMNRLTLGGRGIGTWQWADINLQSGVDIQINRHQKKVGKHWKEDANIQDSGLFAEMNWQFVPTQILISGIRLEQTTVNFNVSEKLKQRKEVYPNAFIRYEYYPETLPLMTYAGLGLNERCPDYWELMSFKLGHGLKRNTLQKLKREKTAQLDIGAHLQLERLNVWLSGYTSQIKNFILFRYIPPQGRKLVDNINARLVGSEMGFSYQLTEQWRTENSLAWLYGTKQDSHRPLPQIPPLEGRLAVKWERGAWSGTGLWRVVTAQNRVALNEGNVVGKDFSKSIGFGIVSANIAWNAAKNIMFSGGIDNIFNHRYNEHLNLANKQELSTTSTVALLEPGRTLWVRAALTF